MNIQVGGDGIVFEVINGIFERWDWSEVAPKLPIGVIPGGSGNGLARSIAHISSEPFFPNPTLPATMAAVRHRSVPMDLVRVETTSEIMFSVLSVGWGLISDIDIESERLRLLGPQRFTIWSVARLIGLKSYGGTLSYLPVDVQMGSVDFEVDKVENDVELPPEVHLETDSGRQRLDSWYSAASRRSTYFSTTGSSYQSTADSGTSRQSRMFGPASQLPCLTAPLPPNWTQTTGRFVMVHASYQTHLGEECFFAPNAKLNDGTIWLLIVKAGASRSQVLRFLLGLSTGAHASASSSDGPIQLLAVRAFRIEPDMTEKGCMTVDGELVEYGPVQAEIFPGLARVMVP